MNPAERRKSTPRRFTDEATVAKLIEVVHSIPLGVHHNSLFYQADRIHCLVTVIRDVGIAGGRRRRLLDEVQRAWREARAESLKLLREYRSKCEVYLRKELARIGRTMRALKEAKLPRKQWESEVEIIHHLEAACREACWHRSHREPVLLHPYERNEAELAEWTIRALCEVLQVTRFRDGTRLLIAGDLGYLNGFLMRLQAAAPELAQILQQTRTAMNSARS